jgi:hypothetical protein|tara:strand:+ start:1458 stop:1622 length:165 start_codon:yes stop_codon:yes gene_type:complete
MSETVKRLENIQMDASCRHYEIINGQEWCDYYGNSGRCGNSCPHYENKFLKKAV